MEEDQFTKPIDAVLMAVRVLKRLNMFTLDTLPDRIRCQKIQYLAQTFKVAPAYHFSLYLRGPYSSDLTKDLFKAHEKLEVPETSFAAEELEDRFKSLRDFVQAKTVRDLEVIVTLHWLINVAKLTDSAAMLKLKELKSATDDECKKAFKELEVVPA